MDEGRNGSAVLDSAFVDIALQTGGWHILIPFRVQHPQTWNNFSSNPNPQTNCIQFRLNCGKRTFVSVVIFIPDINECNIILKRQKKRLYLLSVIFTRLTVPSRLTFTIMYAYRCWIIHRYTYRTEAGSYSTKSCTLYICNKHKWYILRRFVIWHLTHLNKLRANKHT